ncbi:MAG: hypothetical protein CTY22_08280, partial [Methylomonas sp.]
MSAGMPSRLAGSRGERRLLLAAVVIAHAGGLFALSHIQQAPEILPEPAFAVTLVDEVISVAQAPAPAP